MPEPEHTGMRTVRFGHPLQQEKDDPGDCFFGLFAGKSTGRFGLTVSSGCGISEKQDQRGDRMKSLPENSGYAVGPGQENEELEWGRRHIPDEPPFPLADRVTALHDIPLAPGLEKFRKRVRRRKNARPQQADSRDEGP
jgi:hypothetical protein